MLFDLQRPAAVSERLRCPDPPPHAEGGRATLGTHLLLLDTHMLTHKPQAGGGGE